MRFQWSVECNPRWYEYTGQTPEEARGFGWMAAIHPDDLPRATEALFRSAIEGTYQAEYRLRRAADGSYRWHLVRATPLRDKEATFSIGSAVRPTFTTKKNLTTSWSGASRSTPRNWRRRTKTFNLFRRFAEASGEGFGMSDIDGRIVYVNPTLCRLFGEEKPEDWSAKRIRLLLPGIQTPGAQEMLPALLREGHWHVEQEVLPRRGNPVQTLQSTFLLRDKAGNPFRVAVVISDITQQADGRGPGRKRGQVSQPGGNHRYRIFDPGRTGASAGCQCEIRPPDRPGNLGEIRGRRVEEWTAPHDAAQCPGGPEVPARRGLATIGDRLSGPGRQAHSIEINANVVETQRGRQIISLCRDITERKQSEETLHREHRTLKYLLECSDHERQLISCEIHDGLAQQLVGALMQFDAYEFMKERNPRAGGRGVSPRSAVGA